MAVENLKTHGKSNRKKMYENHRVKWIQGLGSDGAGSGLHHKIGQ